MASNAPLLVVEDLRVKVAEKEVLKGLSLTIKAGETHVLLGMNGSGKSTLAYAIMGHPNYTVTGGKVFFEGEDLLAMEPSERARKGVFLAFQHPISVPGVSVANFLRTAYQARFHGGVVKATDKTGGKDAGFSVMEFQKKLMAAMKELKIDPTLATRYLNEGFSGGEKKQMEILQLAMLQPKFAMLDETDSGLDVDKLATVGTGAALMAKKHNMGILIITHYKRMLNYVPPTHAHLLLDGKVAVSAGPELADEIDQHGYDAAKKKYAKAG
ncbi:MAG: Fe-S cluster assembly ATPase SufC [Planctomycetota bacterium]|nr:Fe-S cluster assembly ATPase SufC [Planctomycetota bacterium]